MLKIAPHISWHPVEGELALFDGRDGSYHALNRTAAAIWRGIGEGVAPGALADRLSAEYGVPRDTIAQGIAEFIEGALAKGLLVEE
jgi:hypothetical protein